MSETISLIVCLNYLWSFQTPPPNLVHVKRNSMSFKFWHIGHIGTVRCQEHIVQHMAFVIGRHNSIWCSYIFMLIKANWYMSFLFTDAHVWIYDKCIVWNNWIMSALKRNNTVFKSIPLQYVDKFQFYIMYTKTWGIHNLNIYEKVMTAVKFEKLFSWPTTSIIMALDMYNT